MKMTMLRLLILLTITGFAIADDDDDDDSGPGRKESPYSFSNNTRYMALGDSLGAGFGALPATKGYAYLLYEKGVFDRTLNTNFANAAVPGAKSADVLAHQVPQVAIFKPDVITLSVGGNDLLQILNGAEPAVVLAQFQANLAQILCGLRRIRPQARIYIHNLYDIPEITGQVTGGLQALIAFNAIVAGVAQACYASVADVFSAFAGRHGLLIIERKGHEPFEVHPTNAGYRAIARAFEAVHQ